MGVTTEVLVIGSGSAGLSLALELSRHARVTVVTKDDASTSATAWAQGGLAAAVGPDDDIERHVADTMRTGDGLCDEAVVRAICGGGPETIAFYERLGVAFSGAPHPDLGQEGGHSRRRVLHVGDATGRVLEHALLDAVRASDRIELLERHFAVDLIVDPHPLRIERPTRCRGAWILEEASGEIVPFAARVVVLATGGSGKVYLYTSNPDVATGDGLAMAVRAGCRVSNLEFYQFHPTCLFSSSDRTFLISEAVRGEGGVLIDARGRRIMEGVHPQEDLAPRDVVAREIDRVMKESGDDCVFLDVTHHDAAWLSRRFPTIHERCARLGIDIATEPIPVVPAAHYQCGGVVTDLDGRTDLAGLHAVGEVACTGLHGANRLASNSLLECAVVGRRAARAIAAELDSTRRASGEAVEVPEWEAGSAVPSDETVVVSHDWDDVRRLMWNYVGIFRSDTRLRRAQRRIALTEEEIGDYYWRFIVTPDLLELRNIATVARLVIESALWRKESRGLHTTTTWPESSEAYRRPSLLQRRGSGEPPEVLDERD